MPKLREPKSTANLTVAAEIFATETDKVSDRDRQTNSDRGRAKELDRQIDEQTIEPLSDQFFLSQVLL